MSRKVLVAGIGNIFQTDDGFGVEVVNRLASEHFPPEVRVADFGIRGVHLAYELLDGYDGLILVDAVPMGEPPGTVALIEPQGAFIESTGACIEPQGAFIEPQGDSAGGLEGVGEPVLDAHSMSPDVVLATLDRLGGRLGRVSVVGCQPGSLDEGMGLTAAVAAAVDGAVDLCRQLVEELMEPAGKGTGT